jgi:GNAT superfamily N-acetyltransferase
MLVAVGRYERISETEEAEVAFVVADEFQHHGIGTILLDHLADAALSNGINTFTAQTLADNQDMLDVFMKSGFGVTSTREHGTVSVRFPIEPDEAYRSARSRHHPADHRLGRNDPSPC